MSQTADSYYECSQTQVENYMDSDEPHPSLTKPADAVNQPWVRLLSLSPERPNIELLRNEFRVNDMLYKQIFGRSRKKGCHWILNDLRISSIHCYIYYQHLSVGGRVSSLICIVDESANGTYVNGYRIKKGVRHVLNNGDEISLIKPEPPSVPIEEWGQTRYIIKINPNFFVTSNDSSYTAGLPGPTISLPATRSRDLQVPRKISDSYQIIEPIGEGASGQVYLAIEKDTGHEWAVKLINIRNVAMTSKMTLPMILKEAEIMRSLNHPYIVNLHDVFSDETDVYLVMELLSGGDLFDRVVKKGVYPELEAKQLMKQLLEAINYMHQRGVAHRDLKIENIVLVRADNDVNIKVTDFGLAKRGGKLKTFCGTPNYYAPEVLQRKHTIRGEGTYSISADMWSCGVIMYILLSGEMPWKGQEPEKMLKEGKFSVVGRRWNRVSEQAKSLIKSLLEKNPDLRITAQQACSHDWFADICGTVAVSTPTTQQHPSSTLLSPPLIEEPCKSVNDSRMSLVFISSVEKSINNGAVAERSSGLTTLMQSNDLNVDSGMSISVSKKSRSSDRLQHQNSCLSTPTESGILPVPRRNTKRGRDIELSPKSDSNHSAMIQIASQDSALGVHPFHNLMSVVVVEDSNSADKSIGNRRCKSRKNN